MVSHPELAWEVVLVGVRGRFPPPELPADHLAFQVSCQLMATVLIDVFVLGQDSLLVYDRLSGYVWKAHEVWAIRASALPA